MHGSWWSPLDRTAWSARIALAHASPAWYRRRRLRPPRRRRLYHHAPGGAPPVDAAESRISRFGSCLQCSPSQASRCLPSPSQALIAAAAPVAAVSGTLGSLSRWTRDSGPLLFIRPAWWWQTPALRRGRRPGSVLSRSRCEAPNFPGPSLLPSPQRRPQPLWSQPLQPQALTLAPIRNHTCSHGREASRPSLSCTPAGVNQEPSSQTIFSSR